MVGPNASSLKRRLRGIRASLTGSLEVLDLNAPLLPRGAVTHVDCPIFEAFLACSHPHGTADQIGIGELLAGPLVAIVEENDPAARLDRSRSPLRDLDRKSTRLNSSHVKISY